MNIAEACQALSKNDLVVWSSGNASERAGGSMLIKESGLECAKVFMPNTIESITIVFGKETEVIKKTGGIVCVSLWDGRYDSNGPRPSTDSDAHCYIYNALPEIGGIVHTHSTFATAFAIAGIPIPCVCTAIADEFGGDIPVSNYCQIGSKEIGQEVVRLYKSTGCPAILIRQHGVFTVGKTIKDAVKAAVMAEDCAKTIFYAKQFTGISGLRTLPADEIARNHKRYTSEYGQK